MVPYCIVSYCIASYCFVLCRMVTDCIVSYCIILFYFIVLSRIVLYRIVSTACPTPDLCSLTLGEVPVPFVIWCFLTQVYLALCLQPAVHFPKATSFMTAPDASTLWCVGVIGQLNPFQRPLNCSFVLLMKVSAVAWVKAETAATASPLKPEIGSAAREKKTNKET